MKLPGLLIFPVLLVSACTTIYTTPTEQGGEQEPDDPPNEPPVDGQIVFVTSTAYQGGYLGGLAGADAACAERAAAAHLTGTYKAWLSDNTTSAAARLSHASKPYVLTDGTRVADDWADLTHADLQHEINVDETGKVAAPPDDLMLGAPVWTGTEFDGLSAVDQFDHDNCGGWTDLHAFGLAGDRSAATDQWSLRIGLPCTFKAALYCIEQ